VKGPIGRIGGPIDNREYVPVSGKGVDLHIEKALVDELPEGGGRIRIYMGDYGCWTVRVIS
jgi:hypothetical protein